MLSCMFSLLFALMIQTTFGQTEPQECTYAVIADSSFAATHSSKKGGANGFINGIVDEIIPMMKTKLNVNLNLQEIIVANASDTTGINDMDNQGEWKRRKLAFIGKVIAEQIPGFDFLNLCAVTVLTSKKLETTNTIAERATDELCGHFKGSLVTDRGKDRRYSLKSSIAHELLHLLGGKHRDGIETPPKCGRKVDTDFVQGDFKLSVLNDTCKRKLTSLKLDEPYTSVPLEVIFLKEESLVCRY